MPICGVSQLDTRRHTNFKVQKGHTESINKFHLGSSLRERERERERERIIRYGKYPGQYINFMIYSDQTIFKSCNIRVL